MKGVARMTLEMLQEANKLNRDIQQYSDFIEKIELCCELFPEGVKFCSFDGAIKIEIPNELLKPISDMLTKYYKDRLKEKQNEFNYL